MSDSTIWMLNKDGNAIAELECFDSDWPWRTCRFRRLEGFEKYESLFDDLEAMVNDSRLEELDVKMKSLWKSGFTISNEGSVIEKFIIHIRGENASFRGQAREIT